MTESKLPNDDEQKNDDQQPESVDRTMDSDEFVDPPRIDQTMDSDEFVDGPGIDQTMDSAELPDDARIDQTMDSAELPDDARIDQTMDSDEFDDARRLDETLDSDEFGKPAPIDRTLDSDEFGEQSPIDRTLDSDEFAEQPRIDATLDSVGPGAATPGDSAFDVDGPAKGIGQTLDIPASDSPSDAAGGDIQSTLDSSEIAEDANRDMTQVWGDQTKNARPRMTIKGEGKATVNERSTLVIQPRAFRQATEKKTSQSVRADYDLLRLLGEGGMGVVYMARQASIDRTVAIKMLKKATAKDDNQRRKFLSEAVITGDLDHPNIVPIYDLGINDEGALFYAMKRVQGTPWDDKLTSLSLPENLETLMKVADAVGFAHSRGIIHRDLKPENVMLGDFGEVLVMDWGLAIPTDQFKKSNNVATSFSMGGTPAYMSPEMAVGPFDQISYCSDIYLLGAILYEIVTGKTAHTGKDVMKCLIAASKNRITPTKRTGELVDIALKAMATAPKDRYESVKDFQQAIRDYLAHSESLALTARAKEQLSTAKESNDYQDYAQAVFAFQEAVNLWSENGDAAEGLQQAKLDYARSAYQKGDYDLGASLLDCDLPEHEEVHEQIRLAQAERDARQRRLKTAKRAIIGMVALVFLIVSVAFVAVNEQRRRAVIAEGEAVAAKEVAVKERERAETEEQRAKDEWARAEQEKQKAVESQKKEEQAKIAAVQAQQAEAQARELAVEERNKAVEAKQQEEIAKQDAIVARDEAIEAEKQEAIAKTQAEQQAYIAQIGLAAAKIEENAFGTARDLLAECKPELRNWEWGRLKYLCDQGFREFPSDTPLESVDVSRDGRRLVVGGWNGMARIWSMDAPDDAILLPHDAECFVNAVAFSPDGRLVVTGCSDPVGGYLRLWDAATGELLRKFEGHTDTVLSVAFSGDGSRLLSSSYDETARLWNVATGETLQTYRGHDWWVWSAAFSPNEERVVTASQDGSVIVWDTLSGEMIGTPFIGHRKGGSQTPVYTAVFSPDGKWVASGGLDNRVLLWKPGEIQPFDYAAVIAGEEPPTPPCVALVGHKAAVRALVFSDDGRRLISGSQDNTVNVWETATGTLIKTLRGHDGWVRACRYLGDQDVAISCSHDGSVKIWDIEGYEEARVLRSRVFAGHLDAILAASYSMDGKHIITASRDRSAKSWNFKTGAQEQTFREGHQFTASTAVFFPGGKHLLTTSVDNSVRVWDVATGAEIVERRMQGAGRRGAAAVSPDGRWVLSGGDPKPDGAWSALLWDAETAEIVHELAGHKAEVTAAAISPDGTVLFTGDADGEGILWNRETGEEISHFWDDAQINAVAFLPVGNELLTANAMKTVRRWKVPSAEEVESWSLKHPGPVYSMAVSADGLTIMTACADGQVRVWDTDSASERFVLPLQGGPAAVAQNLRQMLSEYGLEEAEFAKKCQLPKKIVSDALIGKVSVGAESLQKMAEALELKPTSLLRTTFSVAISPDGSTGLTVSAADRQVRVWDLATGQERRFPISATQLGPFLDMTSPYYRGLVWSATFSPSGDHAVTVGGDSARLWTMRKDTPPQNRELMSFSPHGAVASAEFSPDGRYVVTGSWDNSARVWDASTGGVVCKLGQHLDKPHEQHQGKVNSAVFSPDGQFVLTASDDQTAKVWRVSDWDLVRTLRGHQGAVMHAVFSHDGRRILTSSEDATSRIWDAATGEQQLVLSGHEWAVLHAAFSLEDDYVVTGSADNTAKVWKLEDGEARELYTLQGHTASITSVAFSPDKEASRVLTGSEDYTAILWDAQKGQEILTLKGHTQEITSVAFAPDAKSALTSSRDGTAIVWLTEPWLSDEAQVAAAR